MADPIEQLAAALVDHRDRHPDDDERTVRIWIDKPGVSDDQMYHRFSEQQIAKLATLIQTDLVAVLDELKQLREERAADRGVSRYSPFVGHNGIHRTQAVPQQPEHDGGN